MQESQQAKVLIYNPFKAFLDPWFGRCDRLMAFSDLPDGLPQHVTAAVMISDMDIYEAGHDDIIDEETPLRADSHIHRHEESFGVFCRRHGLRPTILRCAHIIATGMDGLPMRLVQGISSGRLTHIRGCNGNVPVVHARDIARLSLQLAACGETVNISDGTNPPTDTLIDALAVRVDNKRVFTVGPGMGRILYSREHREMLSRRRILSDARLQRLITEYGLESMTVVTEYITTHEYTDEDI